jgi:putative spermidine/putrescine transport system substrate-binding protein
MAPSTPRILLHRLLAAGALLLAVGPAPAAAQDLTVVSWGGAYTRSQMLGYIRPFQEETGTQVEVVDYDGGLAEIRAQVRSYNVKWDVVDLELGDLLRACEAGLLASIDADQLPPSPEGVPAREDFISGALQECGVGSVVWSTVIGYDPADFPEGAPERLEAFFNLQAYPGKRGMRRTPKGNLEWALVADGVDPERVYEVLDTEAGLDRAFDVLSRIKPHIVWWRSGAEAVRLLREDRVRMSTVYSGRLWEANTNRGADLAMIWDHQVWNMDLWAILRHTPNLETAREFVRYATTTESLARQARHIPYGPVRRSSQPLVPDAMKPYLPTRGERLGNAIPLNASWWAEHFERINARFQRWAQRPVQVPRNLPH